MIEKTVFDGTIEGKEVKTIVKVTQEKKQWFAKPKNFDTITPHFVEFNGELSVHQDSPDGRFRKLDVESIGSSCIVNGQEFASNNGLDYVILPMETAGENYSIESSGSSVKIVLPAGSCWGLFAFGTWGSWQEKQ